jgi:type II secretory pathway component PulJ
LAEPMRIGFHLPLEEECVAVARWRGREGGEGAVGGRRDSVGWRQSGPCLPKRGDGKSERVSEHGGSYGEDIAGAVSVRQVE